MQHFFFIWAHLSFSLSYLGVFFFYRKSVKGQHPVNVINHKFKKMLWIINWQKTIKIEVKVEICAFYYITTPFYQINIIQFRLLFKICIPMLPLPQTVSSPACSMCLLLVLAPAQDGRPIDLIGLDLQNVSE